MANYRLIRTEIVSFNYLKPSAIVNVENGRVLPIMLVTFHKFVVVIQLFRVAVVESKALNSNEILVKVNMVNYS